MYQMNDHSLHSVLAVSDVPTLRSLLSVQGHVAELASAELERRPALDRFLARLTFSRCRTKREARRVAGAVRAALRIFAMSGRVIVSSMPVFPGDRLSFKVWATCWVGDCMVDYKMQCRVEAMHDNPAPLRSETLLIFGTVVTELKIDHDLPDGCDRVCVNSACDRDMPRPAALAEIVRVLNVARALPGFRTRRLSKVVITTLSTTLYDVDAVEDDWPSHPGLDGDALAALARYDFVVVGDDDV